MMTRANVSDVWTTWAQVGTFEPTFCNNVTSVCSLSRAASSRPVPSLPVRQKVARRGDTAALIKPWLQKLAAADGGAVNSHNLPDEP